MKSMRNILVLLLSSLVCLITSCKSEKLSAGPFGDPGTVPDGQYHGAVDVALPPERPTVGQWFTIDVGLRELNPTTKAAGDPINITTDDGDNVSYKPSTFELKPGKRKLVKVKINKSGAGIVPIALFAEEEYYPYKTELEVGFQGHLKLPNSVPLSYGDPAAVNISIVDGNDKSLSVDAPLEMDIQAVDALLSDGLAPQGSAYVWANHIRLPIHPGARSSPQFQIKSTNIQGGSVHLLATLNLQFEGPVVAQDSFSLNVNPALWLPILLAICGSLLYGAYSFVQVTKTRWQDISLQIATSIIGGIIAYLFANFDLLGIKLDPNVLKTYPLLGFLFSYIGIEVLLSKRFRASNNVDPKKPSQISQSKQSAAGTDQ
jgi:hypothetical protein